jgi:hypothetical protein
MISWPRPGQRVQVWYRRVVAPLVPLHGHWGSVAIAGRRAAPGRRLDEVR